MKYNYILKQRDGQEVDSFSFAWIWWKCCDLKIKKGESVEDSIKYAIDAKEHLIEGIQKIRDEQNKNFQEIKPLMISKINQTNNLIELLDLINQLKYEYSGKEFTLFKEDEVYYLMKSIEKIDAFVKFLKPHIHSDLVIEIVIW